MIGNKKSDKIGPITLCYLRTLVRDTGILSYQYNNKVKAIGILI